MKKSIVVILLMVLALSFALPQRSEARGGGWWILPAFVGGMILGSAVTAPYEYAYPPPRPVYAYPPARVYVYPPREYGHYPPGQAYAYPEQGYTPRYESPRGQWVIVPGQWVEGRWVPRHKAWATLNP